MKESRIAQRVMDGSQDMVLPVLWDLGRSAKRCLPQACGQGNVSSSQLLLGSQYIFRSNMHF